MSNGTPRLYDSLDGQTALVTGATRGIGAEIAGQLVELGAMVYAGARDTGDVSSPEQRPIQLDVTDEGEIAAAADRIADETGRLDVLVNNAGVFSRCGSLEMMDTGAFDRTIAVNLRGPTLVSKQMLPLLLATDAPRVVNLSSNLGQFTDGMGASYPAYRISKVGLAGLTGYLDGEYGEEGLLANAVSPGWVRTDMGGSQAPRAPAEGAETPVWLCRFRPGSPSGAFWRDRERIEW